MKKGLLVTGIFMSLLVAFYSCDKNTDLPDSLKNILKRNNVSEDGSTGTASGAGTQSVTYAGLYDYEVKALLKNPYVQGWAMPTCASCNDYVLPHVNINNNCQRDIYVSAAVSFAYAVELQYRFGDKNGAAINAKNMHDQLLLAKQLCGGTTINTGSCLTFSIYPC